MSDKQEGLAQARDWLRRAKRSYEDNQTPPEYAAVEAALLGIGHALVAIAELMEVDAPFDDEFEPGEMQ